MNIVRVMSGHDHVHTSALLPRLSSDKNRPSDDVRVLLAYISCSLLYPYVTPDRRLGHDNPRAPRTDLVPSPALNSP
ncbi:hypothetical protein G7K_0509-t1 [Saitoella complicata NRRL Y-17804]|uniref:Uncharacterized protein n=1 Tax=Saitoella complicata (strain BCRC 22490 / CBS 7301 / JCM 7358 / NBRC 10748 / NRRL Y-17804) TaxID=698492 RepID=A0A0E9N976_SAICN|nr:hypothetical protein G7K_0509-t1 [Saitoella complicata NRRL Y-17804]